MRLHEELYFEINAEGDRESIDKFVAYMTSGVLDDFFEFTSDYVIYGDGYDDLSKKVGLSVTFANDDYGIDIDSLNPEKLLDVICNGAKNLHVHGTLFDVDDEEYRFISAAGNASYENADEIEFSDELDEEARRESYDDDDYE